MTEGDLLEELAGIKAVVAGSEPYTPRVFQKHPHVRVIARAGVGYDAVDLLAAISVGAAVTITPGTNQDANRAAPAFALMWSREALRLHIRSRKLKWPRKATIPLRGRTLGIAGLGRIGKAMALRGECFGMKLIAYEPFPDREFLAKHQITLVSQEELFRQSDYLTQHMPSTPESRHMVNAKTLALMKPTSYVFNTARGSIIHEPDLIAALKAGTIAGAGLDVFEEEPPRQ